MMLVPRRNSFDLFDDFFEDDFFSKKDKSLMRTDIKELDNKYVLDIDLPGFSKENINLSLENGYLNVSASTEKNEEEKHHKMVRQERFYGTCNRSFYVGDNIIEDDINASFKNGILTIELPKKNQEQIETKKQIEIK